MHDWLSHSLSRALPKILPTSKTFWNGMCLWTRATLPDTTIWVCPSYCLWGLWLSSFTCIDYVNILFAPTSGNCQMFLAECPSPSPDGRQFGLLEPGHERHVCQGDRSKPPDVAPSRRETAEARPGTPCTRLCTAECSRGQPTYTRQQAKSKHPPAHGFACRAALRVIGSPHSWSHSLLRLLQGAPAR